MDYFLFRILGRFGVNVRWIELPSNNTFKSDLVTLQMKDCNEDTKAELRQKHKSKK